MPDNAIKFIVGLLLCTFGTFWSVEGLGVFAADQASLGWPLGDASIAVILVAWLLVAWLMARWLRRGTARPAAAAPGGPAVAG